MGNINSVTLVGNLTRDPELRHTPAGNAVASLRIAVNDRGKDAQGNWVDVPYYFNVTVWGNQGEAVAEHMSKGRRIGVQGKLTWREWEAQDGSKRQEVEINAFTVMFLDSKGEGGGGSRESSQFVPAGAAADATDFGAAGADDDIPF